MTWSDLERLNNLGHLSAGVGHHVINAFSAIVSNAELLRLNPPLPAAIDPAVAGRDDRADGARGLDGGAPADRLHASADVDRPGPGGVRASTIALDRLVAEVVAEEQAAARRGRTGTPSWRRSRRSGAMRCSCARCSGI